MFLFLLSVALINPQITWNRGAPSVGVCVPANYGQLYTDVGSGALSVCAEAGWVTVSGPVNTPSTTYYLAPDGNDANPGTAAQPWLSPNHTVNCGDTLLAVAGNYAAANYGKWGYVNCATGSGVAWVQCQVFDTCKLVGSMSITASYWGIQGWEVSNSGNAGPCFGATPASAGLSIHHVVFANNVANGCGAGGISVYNNGTAGVDYVGVIGNVVYNAAQNNTHCYSGISMYQLVAADARPGTHVFIAGNISYRNVNPPVCQGASDTDGNGIILDTLDGCPPGSGCPGGTGVVYAQQIAVENNIVYANGGRGWEVQTYTKNAISYAKVLFAYNTSWGNATSTSCVYNLTADSTINIAYGVTVTRNIGQTNAATACGAHALYGMYVYDGSGANDAVFNNWFVNTGSFNDDGNTAHFGANSAVSPAFVGSPSTAAPACAGTSNAMTCMNSVITSLKPTATGSTVYGYQQTTALNGADPYFPRWLCSINIPGGLITKSCL